MWLRGNAAEDWVLGLAEFLDVDSACGNVDIRITCDVGHTCGEDTTRSNEFFIACRQRAPDVSRLGRDLARVLLCDATAVVVVFSSLVARQIHSFLQ